MQGANPLTDFNFFYGLLHAQLCYTSISNLTWFASQVTDLLLRTARRSFRPNFSMHPVGKTALERKMIGNFLMVSTSSITEQSLEKIVQRASAVGANIWWWPWVTPNPGFKVTGYLQVERKLLKNTNRKPYTIYRMVPLSMTLSDLRPRFQGHRIFRH